MKETKQKQPQPETQTSADENQPRVLLWIIGFPLLVLVYILSVGPTRLVMNNINAPTWLWQIFRGFYFPIVWLYYQSETCERFLEAYFEWWMNIV